MTKKKIYSAHQTLQADMLTPVHVYLKIRDTFSNPIMLESYDQHLPGRQWSYICCDPLATITISGNQCRMDQDVFTLDGMLKAHDYIRQFMERYEPTQLNFPFTCQGLFGYTAYNGLRHHQQISFTKAPGISIPDVYYAPVSYTHLFRRTRLLGIFILLPIIVNIVCIDVLYNIGHVTLLATTLLLGLVYLLFQEREKLLRFFFYTESAMPAFHFKSLVLKNLARLSTLGIPCLVLVPAIKPVSNATILGKYSITSLKVNSKQIPMDMNNDSLLTAVYFDQNETCMLRYNNYHHLKIGGALYDANSGTLKVRWRYPVRENDTTVFRFSGQGDQKILSGKINGDNITATLIKTDLPDEVIK